MKKVLFVATVVKMHINEFHLPYMREFKMRGWQVDVAAKNDFVPKKDIQIPFCDKFFDIEFRRNPLSIGNIKIYKKLKRIILENGYDLLICNTPVGGAIARMAGKNISKLKIVYICHGFHFFKGNNWYKNIIFLNIEKFLAKYTDCLLTVNEEDYQAGTKFRLRRNGKVYKINSIGCDVNKIKKSEGKREKYRTELGIDKNTFVVITVAELNRNKNQKVAIESFAKANIPNSLYILCGCGNNEVELKKLTKKLNVENKVVFLGYRHDIPSLLYVADCFLFTSRREGLGMAIVEAMAAGLPVLVSDIRGPRDCIVPGESGFAFCPDDVDGFKNGLQRIYNMQDVDRRNIKLFNKEHSKKFAIENVVENVFRIYHDMGIL